MTYQSVFPAARSILMCMIGLPWTTAWPLDGIIVERGAIMLNR